MRSDVMVHLFCCFCIAGIFPEQVRRHFAEETDHKKGPRARLLRLSGLGPRQARREQQRRDGPSRRAPEAQAAADGVPPASPAKAGVHVGVVARVLLRRPASLLVMRRRTVAAVDVSH